MASASAMAQANEREHGNERVDACEKEWESAWDEWRRVQENGQDQELETEREQALGKEPARESGEEQEWEWELEP